MTDVEQIFPLWRTARIILREYVNNVEWRVTFDGSTANVTLASSIAIETMPPEARNQVSALVAAAMAGYFPDLSDLLMAPTSDLTRHRILNEFRQHEYQIVSAGNPDLKTALWRTLGLGFFPEGKS